MKSKAIPISEKELLHNAEAMAGKTLRELATANGIKLPESMLKAKGFVGELIETHLGADAGNQSLPDFSKLGIELKTIPLNAKHEPSESTYVCTAPLEGENNFSKSSSWEHSRVRRKLLKVLWVPIEASKEIPLPDRRIGMPMLWNMDTETENILKKDWEELMEMIHLGKITECSAHHGTYLQIRPKAANSRILMETINEDGEEILVGPKGFYLRTLFTKRILKQYYA